MMAIVYLENNNAILQIYDEHSFTYLFCCYSIIICIKITYNDKYSFTHTYVHQYVYVYTLIYIYRVQGFCMILNVFEINNSKDKVMHV